MQVWLSLSAGADGVLISACLVGLIEEPLVGQADLGSVGGSFVG